MSLFPRQLCPGQTLTIHLRRSPSAPCFRYVRTLIRDPAGAAVFEHAFQEPLWVPLVPSEPALPRFAVEGLYETTPLLFVADYLREDAAERGELVRILEDIQHARHTYLHWTVPPAARPGRYEVAVLTWINGHEHTSPTAKDDHFFVERLSLESWEPAAGGARARIRNHSPEPIAARVHELYRDGAAGGAGAVRAAVRRELLAPESVSELRLGSARALLQYAEDSARIWLAAEPQPTFIRSPSCAWMAGRGESVVVTAQATRRSFTLQGPARAIWLAADGFSSRRELRELGPAAFEALLDAGLLQQLPA